MDSRTVFNLFTGDVPPSTQCNVNVMGTREATVVIPKWSAGENIVTFCKKVEAAWDYCQTENFEEAKFCKILKLQLSTDAAEVVDNMSTDDRKTVAKITNELRNRLGKQPSEYLRDFSEVIKRPNEGYNEFAIRVKRLYKLGTDTTAALTGSEKMMIVETFLNGLPENESSALRLVATEEEATSVDEMAKRASRCSTRQTQLKNEINSLRADLEQLEKALEDKHMDE